MLIIITNVIDTRLVLIVFLKTCVGLETQKPCYHSCTVTVKGRKSKGSNLTRPQFFVTFESKGLNESLQQSCPYENKPQSVGHKNSETLSR